MKYHGVAAHALQLCRGTCVVAGFAQGLACQVGHLVGANHYSLGVQGGDGMGLGQGQALGQLCRWLAGQGGFIDRRGCNGEGQAQALQQFAPVHGGRAQNEWAGGRAGFRHGGDSLTLPP